MKPSRRVARRGRRSVALTPSARVLAACLLAGGLLAGCGQPPWEAGSSTSPSPSASPTASPSAGGTASPTVTAKPIHNDLSKGSLKRKLPAGGVVLSVNYWSTLDLGSWTPSAAKPVNLSATGAFADGSKQDIFLTSVSMAVAVEGPSGGLPAPDAQTDEASVKPGYVITKPNSYGGVFTVPSVDPAATSVTLTFTYQLLQQTAPKAKSYSKQTAVDTLTIPLAN